MDPRVERATRIAIWIVLAGILVFAGLLVRTLVQSDENRTPRTELERAVIAAEQAVRANPENADARIKLAAAYLESGATASARKQAEIATRIAPTDPSSFYILGLTESRAGNDEKAVAILLKAANMEGQLAAFYQDVWAAIASAYERSEEESRAIDAMDQALNFGPENAILLTKRGMMYEAQQEWADALYDYLQAIQFAPDYALAVEGAERVAAAHPEAVNEVRERFEVTVPSTDSTSSMSATTTLP